MSNAYAIIDGSEEAVVTLASGAMRCDPIDYERFRLEHGDVTLFVGSGGYVCFVFKGATYTFHRWLVGYPVEPLVASFVDGEKLNCWHTNVDVGLRKGKHGLG